MKGGGGGGGERGCHGQNLLFPEDFHLKRFTAYDYLGQLTHWLILASRLERNCVRFETQLQYRPKTLWVCVEVGPHGTKELITAVPQHVLNWFAQVF